MSLQFSSVFAGLNLWFFFGVAAISQVIAQEIVPQVVAPQPVSSSIQVPLENEAPAPAPFAKRFSLLVEPFTGSVGDSSAQVLRESMRREGFFTLVTSADASDPPWAVRADASSRRIEASLISPGGAVIWQRTYQDFENEAPSTLAEKINRLVSDIMLQITGRKAMASAKLAFSAGSRGKKEIYLCQADGRELRKLTSDGLCVSPSLSPDGRFLLYTGYQSGYGDLYFLDLVMGNKERLVDAAGTTTGASFSPNGKRLAVAMSFGGSPDIFIADFSQSTGRVMATHPGIDCSPDWSPDGRRIVFVSTRKNGVTPSLYIANTESMNAQALNLPYASCLDPSWSPDGTRIACTIRTGTTTGVAVYDFTSRSSRILRREGACEPAWAPTGRHIAYAQRGSIYIEDVQTHERYAIGQSAGMASEPCWSR